MPADYNKLLEACPLLDQNESDKKAIEKDVSLLNPATYEHPFRLQEKADQSFLRLGRAALNAQPELHSEWKRLDAKYLKLEEKAKAEGLSIPSKAMDSTFEEADSVYNKAKDNLKAFCKPPVA